MTYVRITRRQAFSCALAAPAARAGVSVAATSIRARLPGELPAGVAAILARILNERPESLNTDWFGTMPLIGLLQWRRRGITEAEAFAGSWLEHHLRAGEVAGYTGNRSRPVTAGGMPLTTYAGHFGVSQVCEEMWDQFRNGRARRVASDLAGIVLHRTARNRIGLIGHDDTADFAIPDVTFFAVSSLAIGARTDAGTSLAYREQARFQLRTSVDTFLMKDTGLAKTLYRNGKPGETYWTRASGWLLWSITALLRRVEDRSFLPDLERLVDGMLRVQTPEGGFHVLLDDPSTPLDSTGPAMFAIGVHESVRRGWLPASYRGAADRAWAFVRSNLTDEGVLRNTYYVWALPAENREMRLRDENSGWAMGFVLAAANEMTLG